MLYDFSQLPPGKHLAWTSELGSVRTWQWLVDKGYITGQITSEGLRVLIEEAMTTEELRNRRR